MRIKWTVLILIVVVLINSVACDKKKTLIPNNPLNGKTTAIFNQNKTYGVVNDIDGNVYKTIVIGNQTWMAENLRTTQYQNGDTLQNVTDNTQWNNLSIGAYCNYNNTNSLDTIGTYGRLYNWYAVADSRKLAPKGWHVPTMMDWNVLVNYLGGDSIASNKLKEIGDFHWASPYKSDNSSGFTALPGGQRDQPDGGYDQGVQFYSVWWASSECNASSAGFLYLYYWSSIVHHGANYKNNGYSVRCIKD